MSDQWIRDILGTEAPHVKRDSIYPPGTLEYLLQKTRATQRRRPSKKKADQNAHLRSLAIEIGELAPGVEYWITDNPMTAEFKKMEAREAAGQMPAGFCASQRTLADMVGALNGYVAFPKRNFHLLDSRIIEYIPVHGAAQRPEVDQMAMSGAL